MKDPKRLRELPELSYAMHNALRGLEQRTPSADTIARIQRKLVNLPPPAAASWSTLGWSGVGGYLAIAAAVGILTLALSARFSNAASPHDEKPSAPEVRVEKPAPPQLEAADDVTPQAIPQLEAPAVGVSSSRLLDPVKSSRPRTSGRRSQHLRRNAAEGQHAEAATGLAAASDDIAAIVPPPDQGGQTRTDAKPSTSIQRAPAPEDEASLMYRAKQAARSGRSAALQMLELHRLHFPHGALAEEREVLAIDVLRRLGRNAEASLRVARFLEHYPHSNYRSSLQR